MIAGEIGPTGVLPDVHSLSVWDYQSALGDFVDRIRTYSGVRSVWRFGSWQTPGVSDMDVLVVAANGDWKCVREICNEVANSSALMRYLFVHEVVVIPHSLVEYLQYVHNAGNMEWVYGETDVWPDATRIDPAIGLIRYTVWASFMWRALIGIAGVVVGLRRFLLLLNNGIASARGGMGLVGRDDTGLPATTYSLRAQLLESNLSELDEKCQSAYRQVIMWMAEADWRLHEWAIETGLLPECVNWRRNVSIGGALHIRFVPERGDVKRIAFMDKRPRKTLAPSTRLISSLTLPATYHSVLSAVAPSFRCCAPAVHRVFGDRRQLPDSPTFRKGLQAYSRAIEQIAKQVKREGAPNPFPSPFPTPFVLSSTHLRDRIRQVVTWLCALG